MSTSAQQPGRARSARTRWAWDVAVVLSIAGLAPHVSAQTTERQSVGAGGELALGSSQYGSISADGRWVVFESDAPNLVPGDANGMTDVFVRDRASGTLVRASLDASGNPALAACLFPTISDDGQRVAFVTLAALAPDDANSAYDVYVRDRLAGTTVRASVGAGGVEGQGGLAFVGRIAGGGRHVVFPSTFTNLVAGDTNGQRDIFVRDLELGSTERVSVASDGTQGDGPARFAAISDDGRFVAFDSASTNLVAGDTNDAEDVFVHDRALRTTVRVSVSSAGVQGFGNLCSLSGDGRWVAFESAADTLVPLDVPGTVDVFVHELASAITRLVPRPSVAEPSFAAFLSRDGAWLVANHGQQVWAYETATELATPVSVRPDGRAAGRTSLALGISQDGEAVLFSSNADDLDALDTAHFPDVFVRDPAASIRALCFGDGTSGPCPCAAASLLDEHEGCAWRLEGGAGLVADGSPLLASDALVLRARGLSESVAFVFQGSSFAQPALPFGDGLRCAGGTLQRLGARVPTQGALQFPGPGEPPLSVLGGASAGASRTYQIAFRTPGSLCGGAAFATTNAIAVAWR